MFFAIFITILGVYAYTCLEIAAFLCSHIHRDYLWCNLLCMYVTEHNIAQTVFSIEAPTKNMCYKPL